MMVPRARVAFILATLLLDAMGAGLVMPVLPRLIEQIAGIGPAAAGGLLGSLGAAYATALFFCAPVLGRLSDRFGRRPVLLLAIAGSMVNYLVIAGTSTLWLLFFARIAGGICGASAAPATAYIADTAPPDRRAALFGLTGATFALGLVLGPALGGLLGNEDPRLPFLVAAALSAANLVCGWLLLPESLAPGNRQALRLDTANPFAAFLPRGFSSAVGLILAGCFLYIVGVTALQMIWVLFTQAQLGWQPGDIGLSLAVLGMVWGTAQIGLAPVVIRRLGEAATLRLGLLATIAVYLLYGCVEQGWQIYAVTFAGALAFTTEPVTQAILSREAAPSRQGELQGIVAGIVGLASIFGPLLGGWSYDFVAGLRASGVALPPGAAFFVGVPLTLGALACALLALRRRDHAAEFARRTPKCTS
jgi:MFS transporter, DHA1 family, tetracycline resistance protein